MLFAQPLGPFAGRSAPIHYRYGTAVQLQICGTGRNPQTLEQRHLSDYESIGRHISSIALLQFQRRDWRLSRIGQLRAWRGGMPCIDTRNKEI